MDTLRPISIGDIDPTTGVVAQHFVFRETPLEIPAYDGHHIALYIGTTDTLDFELAFAKAEKIVLLSTNWRNKVDVISLEDARSQSQFRIESIPDLETGESLFRSEHERAKKG